MRLTAASCHRRRTQGAAALICSPGRGGLQQGGTCISLSPSRPVYHMAPPSACTPAHDLRYLPTLPALTRCASRGCRPPPQYPVRPPSLPCTYSHHVDVAFLLGIPCARCRVSLGVNHEKGHKTIGAPLDLEGRGRGGGGGMPIQQIERKQRSRRGIEPEEISR